MMGELNAAVLEGLQQSFEASTGGTWHKGTTTHHTVSDGNGRRNYHVAEFHHAADAEFCDNAHAFFPLMISEITALRAQVAEQGKEIARLKRAYQTKAWEEMEQQLAALTTAAQGAREALKCYSPDSLGLSQGMANRASAAYDQLSAALEGKPQERETK